MVLARNVLARMLCDGDGDDWTRMVSVLFFLLEICELCGWYFRRWIRGFAYRTKIERPRVATISLTPNFSMMIFSPGV